jgi:Holliday junction resolvase-like predicted endonuclease
VTQYARGAAFERRVQAELEAEGYATIRSAGSHSPVDIIAVKHGQVLWVQVKRRSGTIPPADRVALLDLATRTHPLARAIVAHQPIPRLPIRYRQLTGPGPKDWVDFTPDEAAA